LPGMRDAYLGRKPPVHASAMSPSRRGPGRRRLLCLQLFLAAGRQQLRRHPEVVAGHATQRNAINRTVGAVQREAVSDLGRDFTFRARYDSQHCPHLLMGTASQFPHRSRAGCGLPDTPPMRWREARMRQVRNYCPSMAR